MPYVPKLGCEARSSVWQPLAAAPTPEGAKTSLWGGRSYRGLQLRSSLLEVRSSVSQLDHSDAQLRGLISRQPFRQFREHPLCNAMRQFTGGFNALRQD